MSPPIGNRQRSTALHRCARYPRLGFFTSLTPVFRDLHALAAQQLSGVSNFDQTATIQGA